MKQKLKTLIPILVFLLILAIAGIYIATHDIAILDPKGLIAEKERELLITASALMLIVVLPVLVMTLVFARKYRKDNPKAKYSPDWEESHLAEALWWGIPMIIIFVLALITWRSSHELSPFRPLESDKKPIRIQAVALQWKWLFIYPEYGIATVNLVQFPEKTPVNFEITADAPMNSFWIPQLGGQIYAMPAMRTKLHLIANEPGDYRGSSANLSGTGFAGMSFTARASSADDFDTWVDDVQDSSVGLDMEEYNSLVEPSEYNDITYYQLDDKYLFDRIVNKYKAPEKKE